jgi:hypothetical protein
MQTEVSVTTYAAEYLDILAERVPGQVTDTVRRELGGLLGEGGVIAEAAQLRTYECDGLTGYRVTPALVVLPETTEQVAAVVRVCARERIPFVARGPARAFRVGRCRWPTGSSSASRACARCSPSTSPTSARSSSPE